MHCMNQQLEKNFQQLCQKGALLLETDLFSVLQALNAAVTGRIMAGLTEAEDKAMEAWHALKIERWCKKHSPKSALLKKRNNPAFLPASSQMPCARTAWKMNWKKLINLRIVC